MEQGGEEVEDRCNWQAKGETRCPHPRATGDAEYCVWHRKHAQLIAQFAQPKVEDHDMRF